MTRTDLIKEMRQILSIKDDPKALGARCTTFLQLMNEMAAVNSAASADEIREHQSSVGNLDALTLVPDKVFPYVAINTIWSQTSPKPWDLTDPNAFNTFANTWINTIRELRDSKE